MGKLISEVSLEVIHLLIKRKVSIRAWLCILKK